MKLKWKQMNRNVVLDGDGFFISYIPPNTALALEEWEADNGGDETALIIDGKYYILNGDAREAYEERIHSIKECMEFFEANREGNISSWSN